MFGEEIEIDLEKLQNVVKVMSTLKKTLLIFSKCLLKFINVY